MLEPFYIRTQKAYTLLSCHIALLNLYHILLFKILATRFQVALPSILSGTQQGFPLNRHSIKNVRRAAVKVIAVDSAHPHVYSSDWRSHGYHSHNWYPLRLQCLRLVNLHHYILISAHISYLEVEITGKTVHHYHQ